MEQATVRKLTVPEVKDDLSECSVLFVGAATVILRYAGFTVLTDPNFMSQGERARFGCHINSPRLTEPALDLDQLPSIDLVLLSHYHEDHFDRETERRLRKTIPIYTTFQAAEALRAKGFTAVNAIDTWGWEEIEKGSTRLRITAMPGRHGPGLISHLLPPVMGSMLDFMPTNGERALRIYITGDTLMHNHLRSIPVHFADIDLALVHLGGAQVFGITETMDCRQGVQLVKLINPRNVIPIHYNDYPVFKSPLHDFVARMEQAGVSQQLVCLGHGQSHSIAVYFFLVGRPPRELSMR
jgi:L-ascorbate metabolism protein UlaG (beta-lactamase superfamily)